MTRIEAVTCTCGTRFAIDWFEELNTECPACGKSAKKTLGEIKERKGRKNDTEE